MRKFAYIIIFLMMSICFASASSPVNRSVPNIFGSSVAVVTGKVVTISGSCAPGSVYCNSLYIVGLDGDSLVELKSPEKSKVNYSSFCSNMPLDVGSTYMLFIESQSEFNTAAPAKCPFVVDLDGVFKKIGGYIYRIGSPEAQTIVDDRGKRYFTNAVVEPDFEQEMKSLLRQKVSK